MKSLKGLRLLSLGLNLPAPVAAQRAKALGARVRKLEPLTADPLAHWAPGLYAELHAGIRVQRVDLRTPAGQGALQRALAGTDVLMTSFRPSALARLGLGWKGLQQRYPQLWQVAIVGSAEAPQEAGHDLTYQAHAGLLPSQGLPANLWADMAGAQAALLALHQVRLGEPGRKLVVGLQDALHELALPHQWGLTQAGALLGGGHALYQRYTCRDGELALAALEPKFAQGLAALAGLPAGCDWFALQTQASLQRWFAAHTSAQLAALSAQHDFPLVVCPKAEPG